MNALVQKAGRFVARGVSRSVLPAVQETIISVGFDDCPASAIETALPLMEAEGWRATIYVACGLCDTENHLGKHMSLSDVVEVHKRGHEIADHTFSHMSANDVDIDVYLQDIEKNQHTLEALGLPRSRHFAYPLGHLSPALKRAVSERFLTCRGVLTPLGPKQDANLLKATRVYSGERFQEALSQIEAAKQTPKWLNFFTHDVRENPSEFGCTPEEFQELVAAVKDSGLRVMTVADAYDAIQKQRVSNDI